MRHLGLAIGLVAACGDNLTVQVDAGSDLPAISVSLDPARAGATIPEDFLGASYETSTLIGGTYFAADNTALLGMFQRLGLAHLRIGGNESDVGPEPSADDVARFAGFANAAGVRVIYTLRLATDDPAAGAATARAVLGDALTGLDCFAIGNEPNFYLPDYATFRTAATAYMTALDDPRARYCGPDVDDFSWLDSYATDFEPRGDVSSVNVHIYYGNGQGVSAANARTQLLSTELADQYQTDHDAYVPQILAAGARLRVSETNSYWSGGCPGASDAFASTLWGLDYLHWWAAHDAAGLDFHTGDHVSGATTTYSLFKSSSGGYHVHPLGYAVKAFDLGRHGRIVPVQLANPAAVNVTAYGVLAADGHLWVTLVNKTHDAGARDAAITIRPGAGFATARVWRVAAGGDVTALDGVTLAGAPIADDASWSGAPDAAAFTGDLDLPLALPAASAMVVSLDPP